MDSAHRVAPVDRTAYATRPQGDMGTLLIKLPTSAMAYRMDKITEVNDFSILANLMALKNVKLQLP